MNKIYPNTTYLFSLIILFSFYYFEVSAQILSIPISETNMTKYLYRNDIQYAGKWMKSNDVQVCYLPYSQNNYQEYKNRGDAIMKFEKVKHQDLISSMEFELMDPKYPERKVIVGYFFLENYDEMQDQWSGESYINYTAYESFKTKIKSTEKCKIQYKVRVDFKQAQPNYDNAEINLSLQSNPECDVSINLQMEFKFDTTNFQLQVIMYSIFVMTLCIIQFLSVLKICKRIIDGDESAAQVFIFQIQKYKNQQFPQQNVKFSLITMCFLTIYYGSLSAQNLMYGLMNYPYFSYYVLCAFCLFLLSTSCDMKLVWLIWRQRILDPVEEEIRRKLTIFFFQFYTSLILYFIVDYFFQFQIWFEIGKSLFMVPQIVHNFRKGQNIKFDSNYIFGVLGINIIYPLYFRACPENFIGYEPSMNFTIIIIIVYLLQLFLLTIQCVFGPKSIVPKCLLPKPYNYFNKIYDEIIDAENDCCICLYNLNENPDGKENLSQLQIQLVKKNIMSTPCGHLFHQQCLTNWMNVKLQCPACRSNIPPLL